MPNAADKARDIHGNELYQERARSALPLLVRQAKFARKEIIYADLAEELGMPNARNLDYVLGSIGVTLNILSTKWGEDIPHIESLVVNGATGLPGAGFDQFLADRNANYANLGNREKERYLEAYWAEVFAYPSWYKVLEELGLEPWEPPKLDYGIKRRGGGGEGPEHLALKNYILNNPDVIGLSPKHSIGVPEYDLPSGDKIDVVFTGLTKITAAEVKSRKSDKADILRGLYQCVKYQAVLEAHNGFGQEDYGIQTILVMESPFPAELISLRNYLGVYVIDNIKPK